MLLETEFILMTDAYKQAHRKQYPQFTEYVQVNLTARGSRIENLNYTVAWGFQRLIQNLHWGFESFFNADIDQVCAEYEDFLLNLLGPNNIGSDHIRALHAYGRIPLKFSCLPEGTRVPMRVPMMIVENTHPDFFWLPNYIETMWSAELWHGITTATQADRLRQLADFWADKTSDVPEFVDFQMHDFSMRGMSGVQSAAVSGAAHLLSFKGTDTLPAINLLNEYYDAKDTVDLVGGSVPATEHSVMCAGGKEDERETFERLLNLYPTGIVSVVSDTWDLWNVLTEIVPSLKDQIMARDGKLVIRPDSGNPVDIICGTELDFNKAQTPEEKGVVQLLFETFGGSTNSKGYIELDPHVGLIYGDSITFDRAQAIYAGLAKKGFASTIPALGVGSYTYQYVTRDTFGMAVKATWCQVNGESRDIFKDPVTDDGLKKSAVGRLAVHKVDGVYTLINQATPEDDAKSELITVYSDGEWLVKTNLGEIRNRLANENLVDPPINYDEIVVPAPV